MSALQPSDFQSILDAQHELERILQALESVSTAQLSLRDVQAWDDLLDKKQRLLDAIDARSPGDLFARSQECERQLAHCGDTETVAKLQATREANHQRFFSVMAAEQAAQRALQMTMATAHADLVVSGQQQQATRVYRPSAKSSPRFLNDMQ